MINSYIKLKTGAETLQTEVQSIFGSWVLGLPTNEGWLRGDKVENDIHARDRQCLGVLSPIYIVELSYFKDLE